MSEPDPDPPLSHSLVPDWQYQFLPLTPTCGSLMYTGQLTPSYVLNSKQQPPEETASFSSVWSRDQTVSATSVVSLPSAAWGYPSFSHAEESMGDIWATNSTAIAAPFVSPPDFQSWTSELFSGVDDQDFMLNCSFLPSGPNSLQSLSVTLPKNISPFAEEAFFQPPSNLPTQVEGTGSPPAVHGILHPGQWTYCQHCDSQFSTRTLLQRHARETQHAPYRCQCGTTFSRLDVLRRHIQTFQPEVTYPCPHCKRYRGPGSFKRLDHLTQHLRGYHNMESGEESDDAPSQGTIRKRKSLFQCPHQECLSSGRIMGMPPQLDQHDSGVIGRNFQKRGEYTKHLREVHDESMFPCVEIGCCRVGGRGFFREKDLLKHVTDHHSNAKFQISAI